MCPESLGSLKTEEKIERQCGQSFQLAGMTGRQFMRRNLFRRFLLQDFDEQTGQIPIRSSNLSTQVRTRLRGWTGWQNLTESLILAQDERWRSASYMQVERTPSSSNTGEVLVANG